MRPEEILAQFDAECYHGGVYSDFACPYDTVIQAMEKYGKEVLKIVAEKAEIETDGMVDCLDSIRVNKDSILNCLK